MAKLYWRVKVNGKWTWRPVMWMALTPVKEQTRTIDVFNWQRWGEEE